MSKFIVGLAFLALTSLPHSVLAQDASGEDEVETVVVTMSTTHVPIGEDRQKFIDFVRQVMAPVARVNPNVIAFHVLRHYYGSNSSDVVIVRVYKDLAAIEAECGTPCEEWADANIPKEGDEGYDDFVDLRDTYFKYFAKHSDEIYTSSSDTSKM